LAGAQNLASQCGQTLSGFTSQADTLQSAADQQRSFDFWVYIVGSIVGTFVVVVAGFAVWRVLKKRYVPIEVETEVQTDESYRD
jgi:purine-cytosine permease-like protein